MKYPVLCFDRDQTIDVNPKPDSTPVPLSWVQFYAHKTDYHVWATGNQQLQIEAGIPTPYEARQILLENNYDVKFVSGGGNKYREDRLSIINILYNKISPDPSFIVVDDANLNGFCNRNRNWEWYEPEEFVNNINSIKLEKPDSDIVSGEPYYDTNKHGTYKDMLSKIGEKITPYK